MSDMAKGPDWLPEERPDSKTRQVLLYGAGALAVLLLIEFSSWMRGGGIYSIVSALHAIDARAPAVDVDDMGLGTPAGLVFCVVALGICRLLSIDLDKRWIQFVAIIGFVIGGVTLTTVAHEQIVEPYLAAHGYNRCSAHDHRVGSGRRHTYFHDYVLNAADCPAE